MVNKDSGSATFWHFAILMMSVACVFAASVLYFGYVDICEGNAAWLRAKPGDLLRGNMAVRSLWGVSAMVLCPIAFVGLVLIARGKSRFYALSPLNQWMIALAAPICFMSLIVLLCADGIVAEGPIIIPLPMRP